MSIEIKSLSQYNQKKEAWIQRVMKVLGYTRKEAEMKYFNIKPYRLKH